MSEQQLVPKPNPLFRSKSNAEVLEDFEDAKLREKYSATCTLEDNVEHIKAHLKKISKSLHGMSKSMGDYCEETQILCDLLKNFSWTVNSDDKEPIITKCANVLAQITKTQLSFMEQMNEILTSGVEKHLSDMKEDSLREAQQQLTKARDAYDALHRRLKTGEKRDVKKTNYFSWISKSDRKILKRKI
jgi:DNA anti-recombination protein RmuC